MTNVSVVRCPGVLLKQRYPRFEGPNLLSLHILVHALSLQPTGTGALSSTRSFGLSGFEWTDDKVVKLGQDVCRQEINLELDLLGTLGMKRAHISNWHGSGRGGDIHLESLGHLRE